MKKKSVINLIKYYSEKNDPGFRNEAYDIARDFDKNGDSDLAQYIMSLLSSANTFVPQIEMNSLNYCTLVNIDNATLPLPDLINNDIVGIINAIYYRKGVNKFLFQGDPGTGKTETVKQIARITEKSLYIVDFNQVIDSKLGQTSKNIADLFKEINSIVLANKTIVLFDEIDAIALDRTNNNDLREMGRATSAVLKGLDSLRDDIVLIATTNLFKYFDKALLRRFDAIVNFNRYSKDDLLDISEFILNEYLSKYENCGKNSKLFRKILNMMKEIPYPGDLKNIIKTSIAFSSPSEPFDYLKRLYYYVNQEYPTDVIKLSKLNFTTREIEILTGISKSTISREVNKVDE